MQKLTIQEEPLMVDESLIEEKLKKLLPSLVSQVKTEIEEEQSERSRIYDQPIIIEEEEPKREPEPEMKKPEMKVENQTTVHKDVQCDGCGQENIEGVRYKCAVCADFDYCERCEATIPHVHPFLKIRTVDQTPIKLIAVIKDKEDNLEVNGFKIPAQSGFENMLHRGMSFLSSMGQQQQQQQQSQGGCGQRQVDPRCQFFKNFMQGNCQNWGQQQKKEEVPKERKMEEEPAINEENVLSNAQYVAQYGFDFTKCYEWAKYYHNSTKEELLQICLSHDKFLNQQ